MRQAFSFLRIREQQYENSIIKLNKSATWTIYINLLIILRFTIASNVNLWFYSSVLFLVAQKYTDRYMFWRSLFVLLSFFFWPLCCLFFFDLRILITPLVSWNSSGIQVGSIRCHYNIEQDLIHQTDINWFVESDIEATIV